ncbi:SGNH hydrolase domain-containing protein [Streptomyces sp. IBSNAI002]|uniref:SGNH hydrolase domain-containing protein n=1 Tax=Streptomyces sp. IBSNAI002 TaxID=3457500 RepID=UPI003FD4CF23
MSKKSSRTTLAVVTATAAMALAGCAGMYPAARAKAPAPTAPTSPASPSPAASADGAPEFGAADLDPAVKGKTVLVLGDSWANSLAQGMTSAASKGNRIVNGSIGGCGIMSPRTVAGQKPEDACATWADDWPAFMSRYEPDAVLLRTATWDQVPQSFGERPDERDITHPEFRKRFDEQMDRAIGILTANKTPVYLTDGKDSTGELGDRVRAMDVALRDLVKRHADKGVRLLSLKKQLCDDSGCPRTVDGQAVYDESGHPSEWARKRLATWALNSMFASSER